MNLNCNNTLAGQCCKANFCSDKMWSCCPKIQSGAGTPTSEVPGRSAVSSEVVHIEMNTIVDKFEKDHGRV